jgi:hypothetical protein
MKTRRGKYYSLFSQSSQTYNCLLASKQDKISADWGSSQTIDKGINWIDIVCERGRF